MAAFGRISVVVAVYNGESFVGEALESILGQSRAPDEVCVVDDGSTDGTPAVVARYAAVRYLRSERNQGQPAALNRGVASTTGEYLAFLDADDVWLSDKLEHQQRAFDVEPSLDVVYGLMRERVLGDHGALAARDGAVRPAQLPSAMLIKRTAFDAVGGFDGRWKLGSVVDWYARSREAGLSELVLPEVVYERRIHGDNVGIKHMSHRADYLSVVKAAIDRRRASARERGES
jgi:glycosyltransferase involved in cell wall biosynthesis